MAPPIVPRQSYAAIPCNWCSSVTMTTESLQHARYKRFRSKASRETKSLMRNLTAVLAFLVTMWSTPAFAQVKQWVDENGVVHYEASGPEQPKKPAPGPPKLSARYPLERSHAGLTLGENESDFVSNKKGDLVGDIGADAHYYRYGGILPVGADKIGILFVAGKLAFVTVEYRDLGRGGWQAIMKQLAERHGPAAGDAKTAAWNDGKTGLRYRQESNGKITVTLEDVSPMSNYSEQEKAAVPKF